MKSLKDEGLKPPLIAIIGPTAVGKTELSLQLAERFNGEIISSDSRLFYRGMDIGTAKPSQEEMARVPHHLIDVADPDETWSLGKFQKAASEIIEDIVKRRKLPFLVGGTGQYFRSVTEGWLPPEVKADERLRGELEKLREEKGAEWLHAKLAFLDTDAAEKIDYRNVRRTIRALEVILTTGKKFSSQRKKGASLYNLLTIGLKRPRPELYERVDLRIEKMFEEGLLDEVQSLLDAGYAPDLPSMTALGYHECVAVLNGEMPQDEAITQMKRITRIFVRRQANWFKDDDAGILWFEAGDAEIFIQIEEKIRNWLHKTGF
ncbi:MAG: tRNA (adenosine(37)-N6)-dimethylallyltransferase MiaA [Anaerolineae bacterium]|nr:tRNA (adenosine(37)-N6)-dimethylallyltransferase MiaA [Anaerolineae bacterium]MBT7070492.1 tRNA (adenosine(37)-N6)-dimethylallyltransferase MiaA [Anaerolineae bacterium]MBT7324979.1 tRNA (adenosine(37)-N6)-dimethylallyltransferase MiaA [Anaerolineae bacterium]